MNLFDKLVSEALKNQPNFSSLRSVVEKELLHHDILKALNNNHLLTNLTFIGGTCLRCCYGGIRLSEDLDFTGGHDFTRDSLATMGQILIHTLNKKYNLIVKVNEPLKDKKNVDTWKIRIETNTQRHLPNQRINIDICAIPSYEKRPVMILNPYGVDMGTSGLIIQAQSREEIYADKLIAFALRPNRIKYRDLWDIAWLHGLKLKPRFELIPPKIQDRHQKLAHFLNLYDERAKLLTENVEMGAQFQQEMRRFLGREQIHTLQGLSLWTFIGYLMMDFSAEMHGLF